MSVNIYDLATQLERAMRQLPEYQAVLASKQTIEADATAKALWEEFKTNQTKWQNLLQSGQLPSDDEQKQMEELGHRLEANPQVKAYFEQQQRLSVYIADVEKIIFQPLKDLM